MLSNPIKWQQYFFKFCCEPIKVGSLQQLLKCWGSISFSDPNAFHQPTTSPARRISQTFFGKSAAPKLCCRTRWTNRSPFSLGLCYINIVNIEYIIDQIYHIYHKKSCSIHPPTKILNPAINQPDFFPRNFLPSHCSTDASSKTHHIRLKLGYLSSSEFKKGIPRETSKMTFKRKRH